MVVILTMVSFVVLSLFILAVLLASAFGVLVLLYSTHYTFRSGDSIYSDHCGIFLVYNSAKDIFTLWSIGAALE